MMPTTRVRAMLAGIMMLGVFAVKSADAAPLPPLTFESFSTTPDYRAATVTFHIVFNRAPNFHDVDSHDRQADYFQYVIYPHLPTYQMDSDGLAVIRGEEIHDYGALPIRAVNPPGPGGGWGAIRALIPYTLTGADLSFTATAADLGTGDGLFDYLFTVGSFSGDTSAAYIIAPEPSSSALGALGIATCLAGSWWRRRSARVNRAG